MRTSAAGAERVVILEPGERVIETLTAYLSQQGIMAGRISAIGAFSEAQIKYWNAETKRYEERAVRQQVEVISLLGDVSEKDGQPFIHAHVTLGDSQYNALVGHLGEATAYPTLEVFITLYEGALRRQDDPAVQLAVIHPEQAQGGQGA